MKWSFITLLIASGFCVAAAFATVVCPHCGGENPDGAKYCGDCGKWVRPFVSAGVFGGAAKPLGGWGGEYDYSYKLGGKVAVGIMPMFSLELAGGLHLKHRGEYGGVWKIIPITFGLNFNVISLSEPGARKAAGFFVSGGVGDYIRQYKPFSDSYSHYLGAYAGVGFGLQTGRFLFDVTPRFNRALFKISETEGYSFVDVSIGVNYGVL